MDQEIGITFIATGAEQVVAEVQKIYVELERLYAQLNQVGLAFQRMSTASSSLSMAAVQLGGATREMMRPMEQFGKLTDRFSRGGAMTPYGAALVGGSVATRGWQSPLLPAAVQKQLSTIPSKPSVVLPTPGTTAKPSELDKFSERFSSISRMAPIFMLQWIAWHKIFQSVGWLFTDIFMGGARRELVEPLRDIAVVGFGKEQRKIAERTGMEFLSRFQAGGDLKDWLGAMSEMASAFDVNSPKYFGKAGTEAMMDMTKSAMVLGAASKMSSEAAAKLVASAVHGQLAFMPDEQRLLYERGEKSLTMLTETTAAKMAEIIKISAIWGTDIANAFSYSMASALQRGWSVDTLLAIIGTLVTAGQKGQKAGRGLRAILEGQMGAFGTLLFTGQTEDIYQRWAQQKPGAQKALSEKTGVVVENLLKKDPLKTFAWLGKLAEATEKRGISLKSIGFSQEWLNVIRTLGRQGFLENAADAIKKLQNATLPELMQYLQDMISEEPGAKLKMLSWHWRFFSYELSRVLADSSAVNAAVRVAGGILQDLRHALEGVGGKDKVWGKGFGEPGVADRIVRGNMLIMRDAVTRMIGPRLEGLLGSKPGEFFDDLIEKVLKWPFTKLNEWRMELQTGAMKLAQAIVDMKAKIGNEFDAARKAITDIFEIPFALFGDLGTYLREKLGIKSAIPEMPEGKRRVPGTEASPPIFGFGLGKEFALQISLPEIKSDVHVSIGNTELYAVVYEAINRWMTMNGHVSGTGSFGGYGYASV